MKVVILAGGIEVSPSPYNQIFPKPMLPVGEVPILEITLKNLKEAGFLNIHIILGKTSGQMIHTYFGNGEKWGLQIEYHWEDPPRGTAGAISIIPNLEDTFLLMNSDILTNLNFEKLVKFHEEQNSLFTIATHKKGIYVDFGFIELEGDQVIGYHEKPTLNKWISMGIYMMEPQILDYIPFAGVFHIPDLVAILIDEKKPPITYQNESYWLDIGNREDYEQANLDFEAKG